MKSETNSSEEMIGISDYDDFTSATNVSERSGLVVVDSKSPASSNRIRLAIAWILFLNVMCGLDTDATDIIIKILLPLA